MKYFEKRRKRSGLTKSEVAEKLGVDYQRYEMIERGQVKMPMKLFDKFNEITSKAKDEVESIEDLNKKEEVEKWWEENIAARREDGKSKIYDLLDEFNIKSMNQLSTLMGYKSASIISDYTREKSNYVPGFDAKNRFYTFFKNELNMQPNLPQENNKSKAKRIIRKKDKIELVEEKPSKSITQTLFDFDTKKENSNGVSDLIEKYENSLIAINDNIKRYETIINNLISEKTCYERIIADLKELQK